MTKEFQEFLAFDFARSGGFLFGDNADATIMYRAEWNRKNGIKPIDRNSRYGHPIETFTEIA